MRDHGVSIALASLELSGARLGPATALIDEDVLRLLLIDSPTGDKALQFRYDILMSVRISDDVVIATLRDGRTLVASSDEGSAFRDHLLAACRALPEVTRALRALGSRRGIAGARRNPSDMEGRFFAPLIAARRASMDARDAASVIASFPANGLAREMARIIQAFADEQAGGHPPRRRALEAEIGDAAEPLSEALTRLSSLALAASADVDDLTGWRAWANGVQLVFETADRSWIAIEAALSPSSLTPLGARR